MSNKVPAFEIIDRAGGHHWMVYADGSIQGFGQGVVVINRIPKLLLQAAEEAQRIRAHSEKVGTPEGDYPGLDLWGNRTHFLVLAGFVVLFAASFASSIVALGMENEAKLVSRNYLLNPPIGPLLSLMLALFGVLAVLLGFCDRSSFGRGLTLVIVGGSGIVAGVFCGMLWLISHDAENAGDVILAVPKAVIYDRR